MTVYGGVETKEITDIIDAIESKLETLSESEYDKGVFEGLAFTYKRLMRTVYVEEYCEEKFAEYNI